MTIIVITGTPGTGKTYFSKRLANIINYKYVPINDIVIKEGLYGKYDKQRESYIINLRAAKKYVLDNYSRGDFIFDSHIAHLIVDKKLLKICVVLRCSPYELMRRLKEKGYSDKKILENVQAEILDVIYNEAIASYGEDKVIQIDVTDKLDEKVLGLSSMIRKNKYSSDYVDWLTLIYRRGDIKTFFPT